MIPIEESRYFSHLVSRGEGNDIVGKIDDIESFLHYKTLGEAGDRWNLRFNRINWDCLFIKFSEMNLCIDEHLKEFDESF